MLLLLLESQCGHEGDIYGSHVVPGAEPGRRRCRWSTSRWTVNWWPPHPCRRAQDHLWVAVAAVAAGEGAEGTIKEHLGFQSFLLRPADASSRCLSKEND